MSVLSRRAQERAVIAERRVRVAKMYLQGMTQAAIGKVLEVTQMTISNDLKALHEEWVVSANGPTNEMKARELAKIDMIEQECWSEWERSKKDRETHSAAKEDSPITGQKSKTGLKREGQTADTAYIARIQWCIETRCKILGFNAPSKTEITGPGGGPIQITEVEVVLTADATDPT